MRWVKKKMHCDTASVIEWSKQSSRCTVQTLVPEVEYPLSDAVT